MASHTRDLKSLFNEALDRPSGPERSAYLDDVCRGDAALRAQVEELLAAHDGAGRFLQGDPAGTSETTAPETLQATRASVRETQPPSQSEALQAPRASVPETLAPSGPVAGKDGPDGSRTTVEEAPPANRAAGFVAGQVIAGRYTLLEVLGEGGMGTVYRAEQTQPVKRQVALKLIKIGMDSRAVLARFDAERQALALMDHSNIARVYDGGTTAAGQPFFVMELVKGEPITAYCDRQRLPLRARLELFVAVCQAVQHAHQKGIIHRDLKPSNVMVTEVDGRPTPKVIDFGVAKATEFKLTDQSLGDTGAIVGTPAYMSPEQADPSSMDIDTRTDVYALGVILYELLAGTPPIDAKQFKRGAILEMMRMVREVDPPRPSTKVSTAEALPSIAASRDLEPEHLKRALRGDLDWIVMKSLEKDRTRRYETANGFGADILRHLAHEPVLAAPPSRTYRLRKFVRKNRAQVIAASLVLAALVVGIVGTTLGLFEARRQEKIAREETLEKEKARQAEANARGVAETQERIALKRTEQLAREDYVNRVNRAYREVQDDNVALAEDLLHGCELKRRGWEWHYVERLCNSERRVIDLGDVSVGALAYSPDGTWALSGLRGPRGNSHAESTVDVWDVNSGKRRKALPGVKGNVLDVVVSPTGKNVAVGLSAGLVMVWDMETAKTAWTRTEAGLDAMSVAFSPDGKSIAVGYGAYSGDQVGRVRVCDVASGKEIKAFTGPRGGVNKLGFHPDGKRLAVAGSEIVEVWDIERVRKLHDLDGHKKWVYCLAYSPDGKWLATGGWDRTVKLRDASTGAERLTIFAHEGFVLNLAFSPDSRTLVTTSEDRSARVWEVSSGRRLSTFHGHTDFVWALAFRPDGREICTGSKDGSIRFWDLRTSCPVVVEHARAVTRFAFRRDGLRLLSETWRGEDAIPTKGWNPFTGELDDALTGTKFESLPGEFVPGSGYRVVSAKSPDGKLFAQATDLTDSGTASRSKDYWLSAMIVRKATSGEAVYTLTGHSAGVNSIAFSPDGLRLASASDDRTIKLWDMQSGQVVFTLLGHTAGVVSVVFSPDGTQIVSSGYDATARVWNATPLPSIVTAEHDVRYQNKVRTLAQLNAATEDTRRAEILADGGQWSMAADAFARAAAKEPDNLQLRYRLIDALLQPGTANQVGPACDEMLKRFGNTADSLQALGVAGFCRSARMAGTDQEQRRVVHDMAMAKGGNERFLVQAKHGQWDLITRSLAKRVEDMPDNEMTRIWYLLSLLESGDIPGYRAAAGKILSRFRKAADPNSLNNAAWWCTYVPDAVADLTVPVQMAEAALAGYPADQKRYALNTLGAALYRAGRTDEAIARLDESVKAGGGGFPQDWVYLAMAHHQKGNGEQARRWLEKVRSYVKDEKIAFSSDLVEIRILLREAEALLR